MAHGLEARPPFLDENVLALAKRIPSKDKVRGKVTKVLLKEAARGVLPDAILDRKKHGFSVPLAAWLRGPLLPKLDAILKDSPVWGVLSQDIFQSYRNSHVAMRGDHAKGLGKSSSRPLDAITQHHVAGIPAACSSEPHRVPAQHAKMPTRQHHVRGCVCGSAPNTTISAIPAPNALTNRRCRFMTGPRGSQPPTHPISDLRARVAETRGALRVARTSSIWFGSHRGTGAHFPNAASLGVSRRDAAT